MIPQRLKVEKFLFDSVWRKQTWIFRYLEKRTNEWEKVVESDFFCQIQKIWSEIFLHWIKKFSKTSSFINFFFSKAINFIAHILFGNFLSILLYTSKVKLLSFSAALAENRKFLNFLIVPSMDDETFLQWWWNILKAFCSCCVFIFTLHLLASIAITIKKIHRVYFSDIQLVKTYFYFQWILRTLKCHHLCIVNDNKLNDNKF